MRAGALYLDTCVEPWAGGYTDPCQTASQRSNYALREAALALADGPTAGPSAVITHGANPGLVSHFVKQALLNIARDTGMPVQTPIWRKDWAALARTLGVRTIHIAERDTQIADRPKAHGEFVNTWSVDGFVGEGCQPAELGWGAEELGVLLMGHAKGAYRHGSRLSIGQARQLAPHNNATSLQVTAAVLAGMV